jgi:hypothetical protein
MDLSSCPVCTVNRLGNYCYNCGFNFNDPNYKQKVLEIHKDMFVSGLEKVISKNYSSDKEHIKYIIFNLVKTNKELRWSINESLYNGDYLQAINLTEEYLEKNKVILRTCRNCEYKNPIFTRDLLEKECLQCNQPLIKNNVIPKYLQSTEVSNVKKKCLFCESLIAPVSKLYCYEHFKGYQTW